jgi:hypothetical protein
MLGHQIYEPMVLLTNAVFFLLSWYYFRRLRRFESDYAHYMGLFILLLGSSSVFGAIDHAVHYQLGVGFFDVVLFLMNALSLFAIYYCFLGPFSYVTGLRPANRKYIIAVRLWVIVLLVICFFSRSFLLIKINAALVLVYSLIAHWQAHRSRQERGNLLVIYGLLISFIPIIIHSLRISINEWFNYKDLAHVFMIVSMMVIFTGAERTSRELEGIKN